MTIHQSQRKQLWLNSFWDWFSPCDLACEACCVPCITYGRTNRRLSNDGSEDDGSCCNGSCVVYALAACVGAWCIPLTIQARNIRERYNLEGSLCGDFCKGTCCSCCALMQHEKEVMSREGVVDSRNGRVKSRGGEASNGYKEHPAMVAAPGN